MALALEIVVKQLADSGIIAPGKLENFVPPKASPKDAEELLRELFKQNLLTKFQAQQFAAGRAKSLILGAYTLLDKIGAGGMGQVFKAQHRKMERVVAIKMLPPAMTKDAAALARFQREVVAAAKLRHPNIVAADDAAEANGVHFLVMEYVEGADLSALVKKNGPFPVERAVDIILQAAKGLEFAHGEGVVHRDIKPANLLLDKKGTVKILDMGLARIESGGNAATQAELTGTGAIMGTVDYMAPEQALSTKSADARADIYSLGCSLYYLLAGGPVYGGETVTAKLLAHQGNPIPTLRALRDDVPESVDVILERMLAKKPEDRYQSMSEVIADLQPLVAGASTMMGRTQESTDFSVSNSNLTFLRDATLQPSHRKTKVSQPAKVSGGGSKNKQLALIGGGVLGVVILLAGIITLLRTKDGTLVVEVDQPDATVQVLDAEGKVVVSQKGGKEPITISVDPGKHRLKVEKDGFTVYGQEFGMESGGKKTITAKLEPVQKEAFPQTFDLAQLAIPVTPAAPGKPITDFNAPPFQKWIKDAQALPAEQQLAAVSKKLLELNPGFDGKLAGVNKANGSLEGSPKIEGGVVTELGFASDEVRDISPVRALRGLKVLVACLNSRPTPRSPLSDLSPLKGISLTRLSCWNSSVRDLSPLEGMPLELLAVSVTPVSDLSPLRGMPLTELNVSTTQVADLAPLRGAKLTVLRCYSTRVSSLAPLAGMPLTELYCSSTPISDLSPLAGMPLRTLHCERTQVTDLAPLHGCQSVRSLKIFRDQIAAAGIAAFEKALPNCKIEWEEPSKAVAKKLAYLDPGFQMWIADTQKLPAEQQVEAVSKKLLELNPGFDGKLVGSRRTDTTPKIDNGVVTEVGILCLSVTDISPVRALPGLDKLLCTGGPMIKGILSDLSPLAGMPLTNLNVTGNLALSDLSPLRGMKLTHFEANYTAVTDLTLLQGMPLVYLHAGNADVTDLSFLKGMPLETLYISGSFPDLSPLRGMPLRSLGCLRSQVTDLSPLKGMPLSILSMNNAPLSDLSPLVDCKSLKSLAVRKTKVTPASVAALQKALPECKIEWDDPTKPSAAIK